MTFPEVRLSQLHRADGSGEYSANGYTVVGAVNGPIEVQRRDELPEEATIEINIRPDVGVGTTKERHLESILHSTLRHVILMHAFPRTLIQITLQVIQKPQQFDSRYVSSSLPILPALLQTAMLTLISGSVPLTSTYMAIGLAEKEGQISTMTQENLGSASSIHVFAFTADGQLLLSESEGSFSIETWQNVADKAKQSCCEGMEGGGEPMEVEGEETGPSLHTWLKGIVQQKADREQAWKT